MALPIIINRVLIYVAPRVNIIVGGIGSLGASGVIYKHVTEEVTYETTTENNKITRKRTELRPEVKKLFSDVCDKFKNGPDVSGGYVSRFYQNSYDKPFIGFNLKIVIGARKGSLVLLLDASEDHLNFWRGDFNDESLNNVLLKYLGEDTENIQVNIFKIVETNEEQPCDIDEFKETLQLDADKNYRLEYECFDRTLKKKVNGASFSVSDGTGIQNENPIDMGSLKEVIQQSQEDKTDEEIEIIFWKVFHNIFTRALIIYSIRKDSDYLIHIDDEWEIIDVLENDELYLAKKLNGKIQLEEVDICTIKKIKCNKKDKVEAGVLRKTNGNKYAIKYYGHGRNDSGDVFIYMEYLKNSLTLSEVIESKGKFEENEWLQIAIEITEAIRSIHKENIIHRDLKCNNIALIGKDGTVGVNFDIKIINFQYSKEFSEKTTSEYNSVVGTPGFTAPEVLLSSGRKGRKSDVYSVGCILLAMLGIQCSNSELSTPLGLHQKIKHLSYFAQNIIERCLVQDPNGRINSTDLLKLVSPSSPNVQDSTVTAAIDKEHFTFTNLNGEIVIPDTVVYLDVGNEYDITQNTEHSVSIPDSIQTLKCGFNFTKPINSKCLPLSVTNLELSNYNCEINRNSIPKSVVTLSLGSNLNEKQIRSLVNLPSNVINLKLGSSITQQEFEQMISTSTTSSSSPTITCSSIVYNGREIRAINKLNK